MSNRSTSTDLVQPKKASESFEGSQNSRSIRTPGQRLDSLQEVALCLSVDSTSLVRQLLTVGKREIENSGFLTA